MPNTLIREGYLDSERVAQLDPFTEVVFFRLLLAADDAGRTDGRSAALRARIFPVRENVRATQIDAALDSLLSKGLLRAWEWDGKRILQISRWQRRSPAQISKQPDADGQHRIAWVRRSTPDGEKEFVRESLPEEFRIPSRRDQAALSEISGDVVGDEDVGGDVKVTRAKPGEVPLPFDSPVFAKAWSEWEQHRREIRKKLTPSTCKKQLDDLSQLTEAHAIATIARSIAKGWTGLFPESAGGAPPQADRNAGTLNRSRTIRNTTLGGMGEGAGRPAEHGAAEGEKSSLEVPPL